MYFTEPQSTNLSCANYDLDNIITPLNVMLFARLLRDSDYDTHEAEFLIDGFTNGFDIGYSGNEERQSTSENIPLTVGTREDLWEKTMKEVKLKRVAGPFEKIPFQNYIQSPVGLVPKAGNKTRLIFHLSYNFDETGHKFNQKANKKQRKKEGNSVNACTPAELCSVSYNDLDKAVTNCLAVSDYVT